MAFDVTGLTAYVENNSKAIATAAVAGAKTAALLINSGNAQFGVKGSAAVLVMDSDVNLQDGSACSRTALGSTTLSDVKLEVFPIKDNQDICPKSLWNTYFSQMVAKGQNPEESLTAEFAQQIMDLRAKKIANANEVLLWKGDTTLTGNNSHFDGIIKQVGAGAGQLVTMTGATIVEKLQSFVLAQDIEVASAEDHYVFVGEDVYASYLVAMANKNVYKSTEDNTIFGTTAKMFATPGLNGTNKIYSTRLSNIRLGMDGEGDADSAVLRYSIETTKWYQDFAFALGVKVISIDQVKTAVVS